MHRSSIELSPSIAAEVHLDRISSMGKGGETESSDKALMGIRHKRINIRIYKAVGLFSCIPYDQISHTCHMET